MILTENEINSILSTPVEIKIIYLDTKTIRKHYFLLNGLKEGTYRTWDRNGQILNEKFYVKNVPDGSSYTWFNDGQISSRENYSDGSRNGHQRYYKRVNHKEISIDEFLLNYNREGEFFDNYNDEDYTFEEDGAGDAIIDNGLLHSFIPNLNLDVMTYVIDGITEGEKLEF